MSNKHINTGSEQFWVITAPNRTDLYWRPDSQGYTTHLAEAEVYSKKQAESIVNNKRGDKMYSLLELEERLEEDYKTIQEQLRMMEIKLQYVNEDK